MFSTRQSLLAPVQPPSIIHHAGQAPMAASQASLGPSRGVASPASLSKPSINAVQPFDAPWAEAAQSTWYARFGFAVLSFLALSLAYVAQAFAKMIQREPPIALTQEYAYPSLPNIYGELHVLGVSQKDARALAAHIVHTDRRFATDAALQHIVGKQVPLSPEQMHALARHGKRLTQDLVALKVRDQATFVSTQGQKYHQRFGHMHRLALGGYERVWDQTLSSDGIKGDSKKRTFSQRGFNANLAAITQGPDGPPSLVRSARTDTPERLEELLMFGASLTAGTAPYRAAIVSALDGSPGKDIVARLFGESEVDMLAHQAASVKAVYGQNPEIFGVGADGQRRAIVAPILLRSVMSTQAHSVMNRLQARQENVAAMGTLWGELHDAWAGQDGLDGSDVVCAMQKAQTLAERIACLQDPLFSVSVAQMTGPMRWAMDALRLNLVGTTFDGESLLTPQGVAQEALHLFALLVATQRMPNMQCKSGEDRTLSLVGLWLAAEAKAWFTHAAPHDDASASLRDDFTQATTAFGVGPIRDVRGLGGAVKWGLDTNGLAKHPVPRGLYPPRVKPQQVTVAMHPPRLRP